VSARAAALLSADVQTRLLAIAAVASAPAEADAEDLRALAACLGFPRKAVQRPAAEACAAAGERIRPLLVEGLRAAEVRQRWGAAYALARLDPEADEILPAVLEALGSDDGDIRWAAAEIVQRLAARHPEVADQLLRATASEVAERRKMALYCLRDLAASGEPARRAAVAAIDDPDEGVVLAALSASARLAVDDPAAVARTLDLLASTNQRLRRAAASALTALGPGRPDVDEALARAASSPDPGLRRAAERAIERRRPPP
jgi:hypothetical protein